MSPSLPCPRPQGEDHTFDDEEIRLTPCEQKPILSQHEKKKVLFDEKTQHQPFVIQQYSSKAERKERDECEKWKRIVLEKDSQIAQQQIMIDMLSVEKNSSSIKSENLSQKQHHKHFEDELRELNRCIEIRNKQIDQLQSDLKHATDLVNEKQAAIDTLSDILQNEQEENDRLQKESFHHTSTLYQDLCGRIAVAVELECPPSSSSCGFIYEEVLGPISSGSYITIKQLEQPNESLQVGDIILEVNGHSCRSLDTTDAMQSLESSSGKLKLVVARSWPDCFGSHPYADDDNDFCMKTPPPLPTSPVPINDSMSSTSLDQHFGNIISKSNDSEDSVNSLHESHDQLPMQFSELEKECGQLKQAIEEGEAAMKSLRNELEAVKMEKENALTQMTELEDSLRHERVEREGVEAKIKESEKTSAKLTQELAEHKEQRELQMRSTDKQKDQLFLQLSKLRADHEALQKKFKTATVALEESTNRFQKEIGMIQKEGKQKEEELSTMLMEAESQLAKLKSEHQSTGEVNNFPSESVEMEKLRNSFQERISELEAELREKALAHKQECGKLEGENLQIGRKLDDSLKELQEMKLELGVARVKATEKENLVKEKDSQIMQLHSTIITLEQQDELPNARAETEMIRNKLQEKIAELEAELKDRDLAHKETLEMKNLKSMHQEEAAHSESKELENAQKEVMSYKEKTQALESEVKTHKELLTSMKRDVETLKQELEKKESTIAVKDGQIAELHSSMKEQSSEIRLLQKQVSNERDRASETSVKQIATEKKLMETETANERLLSFETERETVARENSKLKDEAESLKSNLEELKKACETERHSFTKEKQSLEQAVENLKAELNLCKQQCVSNQQEASLYKEKTELLISTMEKDLQLTKQQWEKRDCTVTEKDNQIIKLYSTVDQLNSEIQSLQTQLRDEKEEGSRTSQALKIANSKIESMEATQADLDSFVKKVEADSKGKSEEMSRLQKEVSTMQSSIKELKKTNKSLEENCQNLKREAEESCHNLEELKSRLESEMKSYEDLNQTLKSDNDRISNDLEKEKETAELLRKELTDLRGVADSASKKSEKIKDEAENKVKTLEQQLNTSRGELTTQREYNVSLESKANTLLEQLGYVKAEKQKADEKVTYLKTEHEKSEKEYESARNELKVKMDNLQKLLTEKEEELEEKQKLLSSHEATIKSLEEEKLPLEERLTQITKEAEGELRQVKAKLQAEVDEARKIAESLKGEVNELQRNNTELSEGLRHSERTAGSLTERNESLKKNFEKLTAQHGNLEREKQAITDSYEEEKKSRATLEREVYTLENAKEKLKRESETELKKAEEEIKHLREDLKREIERYKTEEKRLSEQLDECKKQVETKEEELESSNKYISKLLPVVMEYKPSILAVGKYPSMPY